MLIIMFDYYKCQENSNLFVKSKHNEHLSTKSCYTTWTQHFILHLFVKQENFLYDWKKREKVCLNTPCCNPFPFLLEKYKRIFLQCCRHIFHFKCRLRFRFVAWWVASTTVFTLWWQMALKSLGSRLCTSLT